MREREWGSGEAVLRIQIRDLGSGAFLTPGSEIWNRFVPDPGPQTHTFYSCCWMRIRDPGWIKKQDPGSGIRDKHPGSASLWGGQVNNSFHIAWISDNEGTDAPSLLCA
jgi:hypothetical protein